MTSITKYLTLSNSSETLKICALYEDGYNRIWEDTEHLILFYKNGKEVPDGMADNPDWVYELIKGLRKNKKNEQTREFKKLCTTNGLDHDQLVKDLLVMWEEAKLFGLFKNHRKKKKQ